MKRKILVVVLVALLLLIVGVAYAGAFNKWQPFQYLNPGAGITEESRFKISDDNLQKMKYAFYGYDWIFYFDDPAELVAQKCTEEGGLTGYLWSASGLEFFTGYPMDGHNNIQYGCAFPSGWHDAQ
jgi:hypothetical protein